MTMAFPRLPATALFIVCISSGILFVLHVFVPIGDPDFLAEVLDEAVSKSTAADRRENIVKALMESDQRHGEFSAILAVVNVAASGVAWMSLRRSARIVD